MQKLVCCTKLYVPKPPDARNEDKEPCRQNCQMWRQSLPSYRRTNEQGQIHGTG